MPATLTDLQATGIVVGLVSAIGVIGKLYVKSMNDQIAREVAEKNRELEGYKEREKSLIAIADRANAHLTELARTKREAEGMPVVKSLAPVVPESSSPPTEDQKATAKIATLRAELTAAELSLGLPTHPVESDPTMDRHIASQLAAVVGGVADAQAGIGKIEKSVVKIEEAVVVAKEDAKE